METILKKLLFQPVLAAVLAFMMAGGAVAQTFTTLHSFGSGTINDDGAVPLGGLISTGTTFYGTTSAGGNSGYGAVFTCNADGTGYKVIHNFTGILDGATPQGALMLSGNTLYGTTTGANGLTVASVSGQGTVYKVNTDGSGFTNLYRFSPEAFDFATQTYTNSDGGYPVGGLVLSDNTLYGMTGSYGRNACGTLFAINTDGTGFTNLFIPKQLVRVGNSGVYTNSSGGLPLSGFVLSGSTLYGVMSTGGTNGTGTVFSIQTNGTSFTDLYNGGAGAGIILSGSTLYGTSEYAGPSFNGTVFAVSTNGTGYTNLYTFSGADGSYPQAQLFQSGGILYGVTIVGGASFDGTVFAVSTNGTGFTNLYSFTGGNDGAKPQAGIVLSGNVLYGAAENEGTNGNGSVFGVGTNGLGFTVAHAFSSYISSDGTDPQAGLVLSGNTLYGITTGGGSGYGGTVFAINTDGSGYTNLYNFMDGNDGGMPVAGLILSGNTLYGTASFGGTNFGGDVFKVNTDGTGFTDLYSFSYGNDGGMPEAGLVLSGNTLYGTASSGGTNFQGDVFKVNTDGTGFNDIYSFSGGNDGDTPLAGLIISGNTLYGTASSGGTNGEGDVFSVNTDGTGFTDLYSFSAGGAPFAGLILSGNTLYGTTTQDGANFQGSVFAVNTDGTGFTNLYSFSGPDGADSVAGLILSGNTLYGTTESGGTDNNGVVFSIHTDGTGYTNYSFGLLTDSAHPVAGLVLLGNTLYGTGWESSLGGGGGTVFGFSLGAVVSQPPPIITGISLSGTNLVINGTNGLSGGSYETLMSTNITVPLSLWTPLATNLLNVSGNFTVTATNVVNRGSPQLFFILKQQ